jgi:MoaA/NifB/PqqE/SkfB family radical SAM enzyme
MQITLTNYGLRYLQNSIQEAKNGEDAMKDPLLLPLVKLIQHSADEDQDPLYAQLVARKMAQREAMTLDEAQIELRYQRNPLENLRRVVFEYTTLCNLDCMHCRNSNLKATSETNPARLLAVVDAVLPLGIRRFDFIGGEVSLYGRGWLELSNQIRAKGGDHISLITSGWFLEEKNFRAAGRRYQDDIEYLTYIKEQGVTHVIFSLDGPEESHDLWRRTPGLYRRIMDGFEKVRQAGLTPRVSLVVQPQLGKPELIEWIASLAPKLYPDLTEKTAEAANRILSDESNYASNFIDVGGAVQIRRSRHALPEVSDSWLRCKNFFRPSPTFRIKASGEISLCPLIDAGDGYGNVHNQDPIDLLNHLQDAFVSKLHAENKIVEYRRFLDAELFGNSVSHVCSLRVVLTMIARRMHERNIKEDDTESIAAINREVAQEAGFLPASVKHRANGNARPK